MKVKRAVWEEAGMAEAGWLEVKMAAWEEVKMAVWGEEEG